MRAVVKASMVIGVFSIALFMMIGVSAYFYQCPPIDKWSDADFYPIPSGPHQTTVAKSSNGTLYALIAQPDNPFDYMDLHKSTDGYNWTYVHTFDCSIDSWGVQYAIMKINSTDVLHLFYLEDGISYVIFDLKTETNISSRIGFISDAGAWYGDSLQINSSDGIRAIFTNNTQGKQCLYFFNNSGEGPTGVIPIPGSLTIATISMAIQENNSLYIGAHRSLGNVGFWCWDDANSALVDLGTVTVATNEIHCSDIYVNNTTVAAIAWKVSGAEKLVYSNLPTISWISEPRSGSAMWFFNLNGSRLQLTGPVDGDFSADWNTTYLDGGVWTELSEFTLDTGDYSWWPFLSVRDNRFHEPDFWAETLDFKCYAIDFNTFDTGVETWCQLYPNANPSFLNSTTDTIYGGAYSVNIDPRDMNPQDAHILSTALQDTNAENDWLSYSDGILSGTSEESGYGDSTVWVMISFDDGTVNVSYNLTFTSNRIRLIITDLSNGYLHIFYTSEIVVRSNVSYYVVTNADWATIDNTTGEITGFPNARGVFWFHIYANDTLSNNTDDQNITVIIDFHPTDYGGRLNASTIPLLIAGVAVIVVLSALIHAVAKPLEETFRKMFE